VCRLDKNSEHRLHSSNAHLNSLTDLVVSLAYHLEVEKEGNNKQTTKISDLLIENNRFLRTLIENLDFLKTQNEHIIGELKKLRGIEKRPVENLQEITDLTNALGKLQIEGSPVKIVKPPTYNHWLPRK